LRVKIRLDTARYHGRLLTTRRTRGESLPIAVLDLLQFLAQRAAKELRRMARALVWRPSTQQSPGGIRCGDLEIASGVAKFMNEAGKTQKPHRLVLTALNFGPERMMVFYSIG
jgi:hypothetical protein